MILAVYLGHWVFHPAAHLFLFKSFFGRGLKLPKLKNFRKNNGWCTSIVARVEHRSCVHSKPSSEGRGGAGDGRSAILYDSDIELELRSDNENACQYVMKNNNKMHHLRLVSACQVWGEHVNKAERS